MPINKLLFMNIGFLFKGTQFIEIIDAFGNLLSNSFKSLNSILPTKYDLFAE